ncbi:probable LRR receptor-like serine/threonine-protein kinase At1g06840 [Neltuma alba]|uniref:probable LRR receptor-like serine/threonine-protein kinase At1g06840 n=1 Tax=Neltuma alba TaxID=207710 RepID=UPI0010A518E6|nr:probable LRR receptor-like serine/threonine-protein kinase At1g06840 [Prosopis alba]
MHLSKVWKHEAVFSLWFCCWLLLATAQNSVTDPAEVDALKTIKGRLIDPNGNLNSWNSGDPCRSRWRGVHCNSTVADNHLHVKELRLLNLNLFGNLAPEIGNLSYLEILDFMWNHISGSIPKEIGNIKSLQLLLLNGNSLIGRLPEELGYLPNLNRMQIDQNYITGPIPTSFANLNKIQHFHMSNNLFTGQIPREFSRLSSLIHLLLDHNKLSGDLPHELSRIPNIRIIQLDNNDFGGSAIPDSYGNIDKLLKLTLGNCNLQGPIPDFSGIRGLLYLNLSSNQLNESIPSSKLSDKVTTIDLSNNKLTGTIPSYFSGLPRLQLLSLSNNSLNGSVPSAIWQNRTSNGMHELRLDFQNNNLSSISGAIDLPANVTLRLDGNPLCSNNTLAQLCASANDTNSLSLTDSSVDCPPQACPPPFEYSKKCFCAAPLLIGYRLRSPGFCDFNPYQTEFENFLASNYSLMNHQVDIGTPEWQALRLQMYLKLFPDSTDGKSSQTFNESEVFRLYSMFAGWVIPDHDFFGPYELLNFTLLGPYKDMTFGPATSAGISKGALAGIILGTIAGAVTLSTIVTLLIMRARIRDYRGALSSKRQLSRTSIKIEGVRSFTFEEMASATNNFSDSSQAGQGGYGKVYRGILTDGTAVAIKRARVGSLQGEREFLTEIQLLSRLHHRNLVTLVGYCDEGGEQMLVYEFMPNGTLRDHLSAYSKEPLSFGMRLRIALGSAKGILYLHTEADPPVFHRDVKASNILLDSRLNAKVADFGLSRLAPVPDTEGIVPGHVSTVVKGTPGYLDPEYFLTHKLTDKSDVYSFGVVLLELLTGKPPISHGKNLVREITVAYQSGEVFSVMDRRMGPYPSEHLEKFLTLALKCSQDEPDARPKMAEVVRELENLWSMMPESNAKIPEYISSDSGKLFSSRSSSCVSKTPFISGDTSGTGSELVSGVEPTIRPR